MGVCRPTATFSRPSNAQVECAPLSAWVAARSMRAPRPCCLESPSLVGFATHKSEPHSLATPIKDANDHLMRRHRPPPQYQLRVGSGCASIDHRPYASSGTSSSSTSNSTSWLSSMPITDVLSVCTVNRNLPGVGGAWNTTLASTVFMSTSLTTIG